MVLEQEHAADEKVVEVDGACFAKAFVIGAVEVSDFLAVLVMAFGDTGGHVVERDAVILRVTDLRADAARGKRLGGDVDGEQGALHGGGLIIIVVNGEIARQTGSDRFASQETGAERVKRRDPDARSVVAGGAQQRVDAALHHVGGFIGECDRENRVCRDASFDPMGDAMGDDARLARASSCQYKQGALGGEYRFALAGV